MSNNNPGIPNRLRPYFQHEGSSFLSKNNEPTTNPNSPIIESKYDFPLHGIAKGDIGEILFTDGIIYNVRFTDCYGGDKCIVPMLAFQFERTGKDFVITHVSL